MKNRGSVLIEIVMISPLIALLLMVIVQVVTVFNHAVYNIFEAERKVSKRLSDWDLSHRENGFKRPCLLNEGETNFEKYGNEKKAIGFAGWKREIDTSQEVTFAEGTICKNW